MKQFDIFGTTKRFNTKRVKKFYFNKRKKNIKSPQKVFFIFVKNTKKFILIFSSENFIFIFTTTLMCVYI